MDQTNQGPGPTSSGSGLGKVIGGIVVLVVLLAAGYYFLQTREEHPASEQAQTNQSQSAGTDSTDNPAGIPADQGTVKSFTVVGKAFSFTPSEISVKKGDTVKITFQNDNGFHDLRIEGYNLGTKQIQSPASETFQFVAHKAGTFEFFCSVMNHRQLGMVGKLIVE